MSKKKRGKQQPTKPRKAEVKVTMGEAGTGRLELYSSGALRIVGNDGRMIVPAHVEVSSLYERDSGKPKIITRGPGVPSAINIDANTLLYPFASVFAIDTNTREIRGTRVSVSVLLRIFGIGTHEVTATPMGAVEFHDARESTEHLGWHYAIRSIEANGPRPSELELSRAQRRGIGIIVDSDLGSLTAINQREQPYFSSHLLPPDITLIYGSSDVGGTEYIANKAISQCDTMATQILRQIEADARDEAYEIDSSIPVSRFRKWNIQPETAAKKRR